MRTGALLPDCPWRQGQRKRRSEEAHEDTVEKREGTVAEEEEVEQSAPGGEKRLVRGSGWFLLASGSIFVRLL